MGTKLGVLHDDLLHVDATAVAMLHTLRVILAKAHYVREVDERALVVRQINLIHEIDEPLTDMTLRRESDEHNLHRLDLRHDGRHGRRSARAI